MAKEIIKQEIEENQEVIKQKTKEIQKKNEIEKLRKYVKTFLTHENLNENEIEQFIEVARAQKLDPFKKELHVIAYGQGQNRSLSLITGYEVYLRRADLIPVYDFFETEYLGEFGKPDFRCQIKMYRKDRTRPLIHECYFNEFVGKKGTGEITKFWRKMPRFMLKKVTVSQGLRWAFPNDFENMPCIKEEMENEIIDITESPEKEENKKLLLNIKKNMDKDTPDFEVKEFEKEKPEIIDTTGVKLNENGDVAINKVNEKNSDKKESKNKADKDNKIYTVDELFPDGKTESKKSNFVPIDAYKIIFDNNRAKKLKDFMTDEDKEYFYELVRLDAEKFKEKDYKKSLKLIEDYEKIKQEKEKRNQEKGRK